MNLKDKTFIGQNGITLKEYFCGKIGSLEEKMELRFSSLDKALNLATVQMDKRLEGMNEFREQLKDQASRFITRSELESSMEKLNLSIKSLELNRASLEGKASQQSLTITTIISFVGLLIGMVGLITKYK